MPREMKHFYAAISLKAVDGEADGTFEGYGSVFGNKDSYGDIVVMGAFAKDIAEGKMPAMLWQHDSRMPCGVYTSITEDERGLYVKGQLCLDTQVGREAYALLKQGAIKGLSIGFNTRKSQWDEVNKQRLLVDVELWEISLVTFPANQLANVDAVKQAKPLPTTIREFEELLRDAGLPNGIACKAASAAWPTLEPVVLRDAGNGQDAAPNPQIAQGLDNLLAKLKQ